MTAAPAQARGLAATSTRTNRRRPRPAAILLVLLTAVSMTTMPSGALAGPDTTRARPSPSTVQVDRPVRLVDQTTFVEPDGELVVSIDVSSIDLGRSSGTPAESAETGDGEAPDDGTDQGEEVGGPEPVDVIVTVFGRVVVAEQLDVEPTAPLNRLPRRSIGEYPIDDGVVTIRMPVRAGPSPDGDRILLPEAGVYPLTVEFRVGDEAVADVTSFFVRLPEPAVTDDGAGDDGTGDDGADAGPDPTGLGIGPVAVVLGPVGASEIESTIETLLATPGVPTTVVLGPTGLDLLEIDRTVAERFRAALGSTATVVAVGEPPLDPSALEAIDRVDLFDDAAGRTRGRLEALELPIDGTLAAIPSTPTGPGATALRGLGVETVIVTGTGPGVAVLPGPAAIATTDDDRLTVVGTDPRLATLSDVDPIAAVQRFVARLVVEPGQPTILGPAGEADVTDAMAVLVDALISGGVEVVPLAGLPSAPIAPDGAAPIPEIDLGPVSDQIGAITDQLATYTSFYIDGPDRPETYRAALFAALAVDETAGDRRRALDSLAEQLDGELDVISLPGNQSVTLAAQSVPIPLTVASSAPGARQVMLRFQSDRVVVAQDGQLFTIEPGTASIDIDVEARSLGASPLEVSVLSPDGREVLATTQFQVRSTAIPGLGLLISGAGLVLLASWWYVSIRRRRTPHPSRRRSAASTARTEAGLKASDDGASPERDDAMVEGTV